jgi:hypothetical protein
MTKPTSAYRCREVILSTMQHSALAPSLSAKGISVSLIRALFVSATAKDVKVYRKRVQQALQQAALHVLLQEDLVEGAVDVVQLCRTWLHQSDAYIGVYGFRYGLFDVGFGIGECFWIGWNACGLRI